MAEERHDTSPLDNTANAAIQTAKTAKQAKQVADGIKNAKNAAKGAQAAYSTATGRRQCGWKYHWNSNCRTSWNGCWIFSDK